MRFFFLLLMALLLFLPFALAEPDFDNDGVSNAQEAIDGTDLNDASSNLLEVRVEGPLVTGSKVKISLWHPSIGPKENVEIVVLSGKGQTSLNTGADRFAEYTIVAAGRHQIQVREGAFFSTFEFFPVCKSVLPVAGEVSFLVLLMAFFVSAIIGVLGFTIYRKILLSTDSDYPLRKHSVFVSGCVGLALFVMMVWLHWWLGSLIGMSVLFAFLVLMIFVLWAFKTQGWLKQESKGVRPGFSRTAKGIGFIPLMFAALFERLRLKKKSLPSDNPKMREILELKRDISESAERIEEAKRRSMEAKENRSKQEAMDELGKEISSFNNVFKRLLGLKEKKQSVEKIERQKSLAELREEKRVKIMAEDLMSQMAREADVLELPDFDSVEEEKSSAEKKGKLKETFIRIFIGTPKKKKKGDANVEIVLLDSQGNPLKAEEAEFFISGKKAVPVFFAGNRAGFQLKEGEHQLFVRLLGFVDALLEVDASKEKKEFRAELSADFKVVVTDNEGNELKDAFITLSDNHGKRVEDSHSNIIWKSPMPSNASPGSVEIPLNPKELSFESIKVKVVKASYSQTEELVPSSRISTQKVFEKKIALDKIKK